MTDGGSDHGMRCQRYGHRCARPFGSAGSESREQPFGTMTVTEPRPQDAVARVAVAICTYNRPLQVEELLRRITDLAPKENGLVLCAIVVVDDSRDGNVAALIHRLRDELKVQIDYRNTASGDVAVARNAAITAARGVADFIACIDDDCLPESGWLGALLNVAEAFSADLVVGRHRFVVPTDSPRWLHNEPFLHEKVLYEDRSVPALGSTANLLIRSEWLQRSGLRFCSEFGRTGGEDMVFFADARAQGAAIRFAAGSIVHEPYSVSRTSFRYHLWRQVWLGNNEALINRHTLAHSKRRLVLRGARRMVRGALHPLRQAAARKRPELRWSAALAGSGLGLIAGTVGVRMRHR